MQFLDEAHSYRFVFLALGHRLNHITQYMSDPIIHCDMLLVYVMCFQTISKSNPTNPGCLIALHTYLTNGKLNMLQPWGICQAKTRCTEIFSTHFL